MLYKAFLLIFMKINDVTNTKNIHGEKKKDFSSLKLMPFLNIYKHKTVRLEQNFHKTVRLEQKFSSILSLYVMLILVTPSNSIVVIENGS